FAVGASRPPALLAGPRCDQPLVRDPLAPPPYRIELDLEEQAVLRLVPLVRTARRMTLWLRHLRHMHDRGHMLAPRVLDRELVHVAAGEIVVALHGVEVVATAAIGALESLEQCGDRALRRLQLVGARDPLAIRPTPPHSPDP